MTVGTGNKIIPVIRTPGEMQEWSRSRRAEGKVIGCVPTMGALHEGHLSLVRASADQCDETIVTIFVNPLQFGPSEDLDKYPREEDHDIELSKVSGATVAYCPTLESMYYSNSSTYVIEESVSKYLCGRSRPIHFRGVCTVVAKLLNACLPDKAFFGLKDYQQLLVLKRMVRDLDFPVEIIGCPTIRESDGLAMSSRNKYLSEQERKDAPVINRALTIAKEAFEKGERDARKIEEMVQAVIAAVNYVRIDYVECSDAEDLGAIDWIIKPAVLATAVFIGNTRLIDNTVLDPGKEG